MIFVDSSALYALLISSDSNHDRAATFLRTMRDEREKLCTTNYVVTESISLLQARAGIGAVRGLLSVLLLVEMHIVEIALHDAAVQVLLSENKRQLSLVDCTSFLFMHGAGISRAFAFDDDFEEAGFDLL